ncbi:putative GMC oxidoreductase [Hypomontagnella monticulosa]|nr:putative GMC oxidoreductase [Hypomontagnella monticulosa]
MVLSISTARILIISFLFLIASCIQISPNGNGALSLEDSYDYIIVGAGIGGLVVANRLSEDPSVSVLVIEAGDLDDRGEDVSVPGNIGLEDPRRYEVKMEMAPQTFLDGKPRTFSQGKAVGGSTIINGLVWTRGSIADFNAWEQLGNPGWGWLGLLPYFRKSEKYSTLRSNGSTRQTPLPVLATPGKHGEQGPVEVGYPNYFYNQTYNFFEGTRELGIPANADINSGDATGASIIPSSMTAKNQSRADARTAYLDPILSRPNLHIVTGYSVTRVLHDNTTAIPTNSSLRVTGVEFAANPTSDKITKICRKEVILAAGAIYSPVLLQISGIGPAELLRSLGVEIAIDLPGVGRNFQDHPTLQPVYELREMLSDKNTYLTAQVSHTYHDYYRMYACLSEIGPWTAPMVDAIALPTLGWMTDHRQEVLEEVSSVFGDLPYSDDTTLRAGYEAQKAQLISLLARNDTPAYEVMSTSWGQLAVSAMQPFSRGIVQATSSSIFGDSPLVDPRYCSHPTDCELLLLALEFNNRLIQTPSVAMLKPVPPPGFDIQDTQNLTALNESMRAMITTGFHLSGTTSMLPLNLGGVVDPSLRVYGTKNLRVVDASIIPLVPGAHIQAAIYALAEKVRLLPLRRNPSGL